MEIDAIDDCGGRRNRSYVKNKNNGHRLLSDGTKRSVMRVRSDHEVAVRR